MTGYAAGWSLESPTFDESAAGIVRALANAGSEPTLAAAAIDPRSRDALERAAPLYRRVWWPAHRDANRAWRSQIEPLLARHGAAIRE